MIRVCHIATADLWGGAEVYISSLLKHLARIHGFSMSAILFNEGRLASELASVGVEVAIIHEEQWGLPRMLVELAKVLRRQRYHLVHTHKPKDNVLGVIAGKYAGIPAYVRTIHGCPEPFTGLENVRMRALESVDALITKHLVTKVIMVSENLSQLLGGTYTAGQMTLIHNGIDSESVRVNVERSRIRSDWKVSDAFPLIGVIGRLTRIKGQDILLRAIAHIHRSNRTLKVVVIGEGPERTRLQELAITLGIENATIFAGHRNDVYDCINAIDIFVLPSLHEGLPMVLLEAMALGSPVIASRVGGVPEVIEHRNNGLLFSAGSDQELAENLLLLLGNRELAVRLGEEGRKRVRAQFNAEIMARHTAQVYQWVAQVKGLS